MGNSINRRNLLAMGSMATGTLLSGCVGAGKDTDVPVSRGQQTRWNPGPDPELNRDLTPGKTPVRLACKSSDTNLVYPESEGIYDMLKRIRDKGYTATSFSSSATTRNLWLDAPDSVIRETRKALDELDVELFDIMVWTNLLHPDTAQRDKNLKYVAETIECADRLGCRMVTMITGSCGTGLYTQWHPDNWSDETWDLTVRVLRKLIDDTAGCETNLGVEATVKTNINDPFANRKIVDDVDHPRCKVCLDPTNMCTIHNYYHSCELLNECFDRMGELIIGCHAKDQLALEKLYVNIVEVPPGKGILDYETYRVRMSRLEWPRTLLLEHFKEEEYPPAKVYIEEMARRVGVTIYQ